MLINLLKEDYKIELNRKENKQTYPRTRDYIIQVLSTTEYITDLRFGTIMDMQNLMKGDLNPFSYFRLEEI